jgi:hypothetical protein
LLAFASLSACSCHQALSKAALVGVYIFRSDDPQGNDPSHQWDRLQLLADGRYDWVQGGPAKPRIEKTGSWTFHDGPRPYVLIEQDDFPIQVEKGNVRLVVDDDAGTWYGKTE